MALSETTSERERIHLCRTPYGDLSFQNGELQLDARVGDPVKVRLGLPRSPGSRSLGCLVGDVLRDDGGREECVLLQFKEDSERYPGGFAGEVTLHLRAPYADGDDAMRAVLTLRHDGVTFHVPANVAPAAAGAAAPRATRFYSDDGRYCFNVQGDEGGKIVQYDTHGSADESTWTAVAEYRGRPLR